MDLKSKKSLSLHQIIYDNVIEFLRNYILFTSVVMTSFH